jgi:hypothetical protein
MSIIRTTLIRLNMLFREISLSKPRWGMLLVIIGFITAILFGGLWLLFPIGFFGVNHDAFLENLSNYLLLSLLGALLVVEKVTQSSSPVFSILLGAILGILFFINILGLTMVDPAQINWLIRGDWQWHFLGWHIFRNETWQFPLGKITGFWFPMGTSIGYTDSIPLLALLLKPVAAFLPSDFQYIGLWLLICFILQGIFAVLLLRLSTKNLFLQAMGSLFFILTPILVQRLGHPALCAHWLLLAALWLYFKAWNHSSFYQQLGSWLLFISLSATIHPYLTVMMLGLATAFYIRVGWVNTQNTFTSAFLSLMALGVTALLIGWQVGYFLVSSSNLEGFGLGYYSMNLLSPFNAMGGGSALFRDIPVATEGQYEGFNYLGAGILILGIVAVYELNKHFVQRATWRNLLPLLVVSFLFTVLAVSNKVTVGSHVLIEWHSEWLKVLSTFRSTGRFFWPVHYLLLFTIIRVLIKRNPFRTAFIYLSLGLTLQIIDLWPIYQSHRQVRWNPALHWNPQLPVWNNPLKSAIWELAAPYYRHITLLPPGACGEAAAPYQPFAYLAGHHGLTINSGQMARFDDQQTGEYCQQLLKDLQQGKVEHDTVYIVHPTYLANLQKNARRDLVCSKIDDFEVCVTEQSYLKMEGKLQLGR